MPERAELARGRFVLFISSGLLVMAVLSGKGQMLYLLKSYQRPASASGRTMPEPSQLAQWLRKEPFMDLRFQEYHVVYDTPHYLWLPYFLAEGSDEQAGQMLVQGEGPLPESWHTATCPLPARLEAQLVFAYPEPLHEVVHEFMPGVRCWHSAATWIFHLEQLHKDNVHATKSLYADLQGAYLNLVLYWGKRIMLCNTYPCHGESDVLYFMLLALQTHRFRPEDADCYLSGFMLPGGRLEQLLQDYLHRLHWLAFDEGWQFPTQMKVVPRHLYAKILGISLCE